MRIARGLRFAPVVLIAVVLILAVAIFPPLKHHLRAASVLWELESPAGESWFARQVARIGANPVRTEMRAIPAPVPITARFYYPVGHEQAPAVIVLHGVHHLGIEEPRLVAFATALSSHGLLAITPELNDLADYRVTPETRRSASVRILSGGVRASRRPLSA
jgi:poly(3-hydroxybutyrate) depolymerase